MLKKDGEPFIELFGLRIVAEESVPQKTMIVIGDIPKAKMQEFQSVKDVLMYLLEKEQVFVIDAMNQIGRGFTDGTKRNNRDTPHDKVPMRKDK